MLSTKRRASCALFAVLIASQGVASAQVGYSTLESFDCAPANPDPVQINWTAPCDGGSWLFEPGVGCRMWDWHPDPSDLITWTGACRGQRKVGSGLVQWFEHGRPIDWFEGSFVAGKRRGAGRYTWNDDNWFAGFYEDNVPNGLGTALIAGQTFSGQWRRGCFRQAGRIVAIRTPLKSCDSSDRRAEQRSTEQPHA